MTLPCKTEMPILIRRLQPWHANMGKRLVKSPKLYVRDSGLLHYLLGIRTELDLLQSPKRGASWEGFLVEQIIALETMKYAGSRFWFYRTQAGAEIDLVIERGRERIGFEFKCAASVSRGDASGLNAGINDGVVSRGYVVYAGNRHYPVSEKIQALPCEDILSQYRVP